MSHPYGCCVLACSAVFGVFLAVLGALSPRVRIGDCMKCCCECHCGGIPSRDALNDRLYWVEILTGACRGDKFTAWRDCLTSTHPWLVSAKARSVHLYYPDDEIRIINEIIPED